MTGPAKLRVAVAGTNVGELHIDGYRRLGEQFEVVAVADLDLERAEAIAERYEIPTAVGSFHELLAVPADVVDICTPPALHLPQITEGLEAGRHVVCEKPLVGSLADVDAVIALDGAAAGRVMPVFQYRFGRGVQRLRALVAAGVTGPLHLATVETSWMRGPEYYDVPWRGKWATELGGAVLAHAIHNHDLLTYVAGPLRSVYARTATRVNDIEVEDCAAISVELESGALATLAVTLGSVAELSRLRFCFERLTAESNPTPYTASHDPWTITPRDDETTAAIDAVVAAESKQPQYYAGQFARFAAALAADAELPVTLADARASLELVTAIYASVASHGSVDLPIATSSPHYESWVP